MSLKKFKDKSSKPRQIENYDGMVRAKTRGQYGNMIREAGDVFKFDGPLGSWMEKVDDEEAEIATATIDQAVTLAENERIAREKAAEELKIPKGTHNS